ncbi:MAG TPA: 3-hydroxyacyl-ACP dehydratase [Pseudonocardiaceae bacterium]|jgi:3-hydroxyacyl-[acyl-carrier-protein] dehydratase
MLNTEEIRSRLPHRYPMLLVDRVRELVPGSHLVAIKAVTANEPWYRDLPDAGPGAAPERYAYPSVLLVESWCQAAGVLAAWDTPNPDVLAGQVMLFGSMADISFHGVVMPGDVLEHHVRLVRALSDTIIFEGGCVVEGRTVLQIGRVVMAMRPATELRKTEPEHEGVAS